MPVLKKGVSLAVCGRTFKKEISEVDVKFLEKTLKKSIQGMLEQPAQQVKKEEKTATRAKPDGKS
jgi:hypothetical protein